MTADTVDIQAILEEDKLNNLSISGFIANNPVSRIWQTGKSVAVKGKSDIEWIYFSSSGEDEFKQLLNIIDEKCDGYASLYNWMIPLLIKNKQPEWILSPNNYYLPDDVNLSYNKIVTRKLNAEDVSFILEHSHYKQFLTFDYLLDRITRSYSAGIQVNGTLAAWGLTHDDGAIGSLHVLEEYRRSSFGKEIVKSLVNQIRDDDKIPFAQIEEHNIASIRLFENLGFVKHRDINWVKI